MAADVTPREAEKAAGEHGGPPASTHTHAGRRRTERPPENLVRERT